MAILTRKEVQTIQDTKYAAQLEELEKLINEALLEGPLPVAVDIPAATSVVVVKAMTNRIKSAGYKVTVRSDQREGDWFEIK